VLLRGEWLRCAAPVAAASSSLTCRAETWRCACSTGRQPRQTVMDDCLLCNPCTPDAPQDGVPDVQKYMAGSTGEGACVCSATHLGGPWKLSRRDCAAASAWWLGSYVGATLFAPALLNAMVVACSGCDHSVHFAMLAAGAGPSVGGDPGSGAQAVIAKLLVSNTIAGSGEQQVACSGVHCLACTSCTQH
jgi:hypothetical protein